jgi:hypothetical protein
MVVPIICTHADSAVVALDRDRRSNDTVAEELSVVT